jgi:SAM-dependent methyltransferase
MGDTNNDDRMDWNQRYAQQPWPKAPSHWLTTNASLLPTPGRALDIAGGTGRNALWLAELGWNVTIIDVSDVALTLAVDRAGELDLSLTTSRTDLSTDPLPDGPWDLMMLFHYLDRVLFRRMESGLKPGGLLIGSLATVTNLERNERPPLPYLLNNAELPSLLGDLEMLTYEEGWHDNRCDARFIARKPP